MNHKGSDLLINEMRRLDYINTNIEDKYVKKERIQ